MDDEQKYFRKKIRDATMKRDSMLKRFDQTSNSVIKAALTEHGFKSKEEMRRKMAEKLEVPPDPYAKVSFTKKEYKALETLTMDDIMKSCDVKSNLK